jgi:hypothetical protein
MKNVVLWDVALCKSCVNRLFGRTYRLYIQGRKIRERWTSVSRWLQRSSETSVNARSAQRHIPEDDILHRHRCESLKSYRYRELGSCSWPHAFSNFCRNSKDTLRVFKFWNLHQRKHSTYLLQKSVTCVGKNVMSAAPNQAHKDFLHV